MIKLDKGPEPDILRENGKRWLEEIDTAIAQGVDAKKSVLGRYNHTSIKEALLEETSRKCAYCESYVRHVTYGDIEHITPKSARPELRFVWRNLTIACDVCNTNKASHEGMFDPYDEDPSDCFQFEGPFIWGDPSHPSASVTERVIDLNRPDLIDRRIDRLKELRNLIEVILSKPAEYRDILLAQAEREVSNSTQYAGFAQATLHRILARIKK